MANLISSRGNFPSTLSLTRRNIPTIKPEVYPTIHKSIFDIVGKTPLLKLNNPDNLLKDINTDVQNPKIKCNIIVKLEYLNPGGSIKDRIGKTLVEEAIKSNHLKNRWLIEPTSGNTGAAIAMNSSVKKNIALNEGMIIVTKEKCSDEKLSVMSLLGAEIVLLRSRESEIGVVDQAMEKYPDLVVVLDQFDNPVNPQTHYHETALEIYEAFNKKWPDMIVMGAGSGGTFTGIATRVKNDNANCRIVYADAEGSTLHPNPHPHPFLVEGLAGTGIPVNLDISLRDEYQTVTDKEAFLTARSLARNEGVLCGGSAGLAVAAAIKAVVKNDKINVIGKNVVVILPDGIRNYMTKFVLDQWMEAHMFKPIPSSKNHWYNHQIKNNNNDPFLRLLQQHNTRLSIESCTPVTEATKMLLEYKYDVAAIVYDEHGPCYQDVHFPMVGLVSTNSMRYHLTNPRKMPKDIIIPPEPRMRVEPVNEFMEKDVYVVNLPVPGLVEDLPSVGLVARMLDISQYVVIGFQHEALDGKPYFYGKYIATAVDILRFIHHGNAATS